MLTSLKYAPRSLSRCASSQVISVFALGDAFVMLSGSSMEKSRLRNVLNRMCVCGKIIGWVNSRLPYQVIRACSDAGLYEAQG